MTSELLFLMLSGLGVIVLGALFVLGLYRVGTFQMTRLEARRWAFTLAWVVLLFLAYVALVMAGVDSMFAVIVSAAAVGLPVIIAARVLRGRHWLFTPAQEKAAVLAERRKTMLALRRQRRFWLLVAGFLLAVPLCSLTLILALRALV